MRRSRALKGRRISVVAYIVVGFGVCIAALGGVMTLTSAGEFTRQREVTVEQLRSAAHYAAAYEASTTPQALQLLIGLAAQPSLRSLDPGFCQEGLDGLAVFSRSANFFVLHADGTPACAMVTGHGAIPLPPGDWYKQTDTSGTPVLGNTVLDAVTGHPEMTLAVPIPGSGGGVMAAVIDTSLQPLTVPPYSPAELILVEIDGSRSVVVGRSATAPQTPGAMEANSWMRASLGGSNTRVDGDGLKRLYEEVQVDGLNRYVLAGIPVDVAMAPARSELRHNIGLAVAIVFLVGLLGVLVQRRIARPIRQLRDDITAAASDHRVRAVPQGPAEIAAVAEAFNATINERQTLEHELAQALDDAQQASQLKSEFLANMSHEIRTPMNGVLGILNLLDDVEMSAELRDYVVTMGDSAETLMAILNDLLDFSKLQAGMMHVESAPFSLRATVGAALGPLSAIAQTKALVLTSDIAEDMADVVEGDHLRVRQIVSNLVDNAVKFTNSGRVVVRALRTTGGLVRFEITDSGIGIGPEDREHLFEPFVQADGTTTRNYGGTGLGLAICRQLVEFMGGTIGVESTLGVGSTFWFELPLPVVAAPAPVAVVERAPAPNALDHAELAEVGAVSGRMRVLVVEDNAINQKVAVQMLRKLGYEPSVAHDGVEAVRAMAANPADIVLMDIQMPLMDGYEATIELRRRGSTVPIVAMTASAFGDDRARCRDVGMDGFISKPVSTQSLQAELLRVLAADPSRSAWIDANAASEPLVV